MPPIRESNESPSAQPRSNDVELGVLVLAADGALEFASADAIVLLGCADAAELAERWPVLRELFARAEPVSALPPTFDVEFPTRAGTRALRCERQRADAARAGARALVLRDLAAIRAHESELLDAARFRVLVRLQRAAEHELRGPLNAIALSLELLVDEVRAGVPAAPGVEESVRALRREFHALSALLQAFLRRTQTSGGGSETFDLRALAREVAELLAALVKQQRVTFTVDVPATNVERTGLREHLGVALALLAIEIVEVLPAGGSLALRVDAHGSLVLRASLADEVLRTELIERWTRALSRRAPDTTEGVTVARKFVDALGGRVVFESCAGHDVVLSIELSAPETTT